mmetsp:Transcript_55515/g.125306  ORF Transcript_55515/g.125306 Transcript_55515/m.125306 type:complete len:200 (+) Transcript_55515:303-902(+)
MEILEEGLLERLCHRQAGRGIPAHHLRDQGVHLSRDVREGLVERRPRTPRDRLDELPALLVGDLHQLLVPGRTQEADDEIQLVLGVVAREQRLPRVHLNEDARDRPDVDRAGVISPRAQHLRCTVPPGADVLRHGTYPVFLSESDSSQTEVADLQVAIAVHKQAPWLQIAMDDLRGVHVLHTSQYLVHEELAVLRSERL